MNVCRFSRPLALAAALLAVAGHAPAAAGAGELTLDPAGVRSLLSLGIPPPTSISIPALGEIEFRLGPPRQLAFRDGGVETVLPYAIGRGDWDGTLEVRYEPEIDRRYGTVRLVPKRVVPHGSLPLRVNLASLVRSVELPRSFDRVVEARNGAPHEVTLFVQGLRVEAKRLVLEFGVSVREAPDAVPD